MPNCNICKKSFASKYSLDRHMEKFHSDESDEDSENGSDSGEVEVMEIDDEVEVLGLILKEVIADRQSNKGGEEEGEGQGEGDEDDEDISSVDDMIHKDNYTEVMEAFREKVGYCAYSKQSI